MTGGTLIGGRFEIEGEAVNDALGQSFPARDQKTKKPIAIYVLSPEFAGDKPAYEAFRDEVRNAAKLKHRSLCAIYGVGTHAGQHHFVAREWVQGKALADLVAEHRAQQQPLSLRGVFNVIAHVGKALTSMHELGCCHAAVRPSVVWVTRTGRIKLGDVGTGIALVKGRKWPLLPADEQAFFAPEIKAFGEPDARTDVFGLGALLYVLLTGRSPTEDFVAPSQVHAEATAELDAVLLRCLAFDPAQRYASPAEVVQALLPLAAHTPEPEGLNLDFGANVEIDVDIAVSIAPPSPGAAAPAELPLPQGARLSPPPRTPVPNAGGVAAPAALPPKPALPQAAATRARARTPSPVMAAPTAAPAPAPVVDHAAELAELTARLTKNDAPRWIAVKAGMDHGPFTARDLIKMIVDGEVLEEHGLFNMSTNDRKTVGEYPEFVEFVHQYKIRKQEHEHAKALEKSTKVEKRSTAAKFVVLAAAIGAILLVGGGYLMSRRAAKEREQKAETDLAALYESGQVKITGTAGILQHTAHPGGGARRSGGSSGGGFTSYEDAMNQAMELGDATKGGGERQLSSADVAGVMNSDLNRMFSCVGEELRHGGKLSRVTIDLAIMGSGHVAGASVNAGSAGFQHCITTKVQQIQFPGFPAPRMGARYSFNVD
jgi:serine/threonine-protein kinase